MLYYTILNSISKVIIKDDSYTIYQSNNDALWVLAKFWWSAVLKIKVLGFGWKINNYNIVQNCLCFKIHKILPFRTSNQCLHWCFQNWLSLSEIEGTYKFDQIMVMQIVVKIKVNLFILLLSFSLQNWSLANAVS